jgi:hypothetical protein
MKVCGSVWALVPVAGLALASVAEKYSRRPRPMDISLQRDFMYWLD